MRIVHRSAKMMLGFAERALDRAERALDRAERALDRAREDKNSAERALDCAREDMKPVNKLRLRMDELKGKRNLADYWEKLFTEEAKQHVNALLVPATIEGETLKEKIKPEHQMMANDLDFVFSDPLNSSHINAQIEELKDLVSSPYIMSATSGAGKSHLLYNYASSNFSVFLQCADSQVVGRSVTC